MTLNLTEYQSLPPLPIAPSENRRSSALALVLSLLFPGLGHLYLRFWRSACWLIALELLSLLTITFGSDQLHAQAILSAPALYLFAIIDAYFSAREWNSGVTGWMIGANPRITAILNLLTKGFGYFYLGDRTKGIVCFLVMSVTQAAILIHTNVWTSALAIALQIAVAMDGYRVARERLQTNHLELRSFAVGTDPVQVNIIEAANPNGLKPSFAIGFFFALGVTMVAGYLTLRVLSGQPVKSSGTLETGPAGLTYRNTHEGIELTTPEDWNSVRSEDTLVTLRSDGASVIVQEQFAIYSVGSMLDATQKGIRNRHPSASFSPLSATIAGRSVTGFEAAFDDSNGKGVQQRVFGLRRGFKIFILIETWTIPANRPALDKIEQSVHLQ